MTGALSIDGATRLYLVVGDPVAQVQTPRLINPVFARLRAGIVAVPFHLPVERFNAAWSLFMATDTIAGLGVTTPHKISAAQRCDRLTPAAEAVGAVNAVRAAPDGAVVGALFDGFGFVEGLGAHRSMLDGATVTLVGAGGAGRAIAHALASEKVARIHVLDADSHAADHAVRLIDRSAGRALAEPTPPSSGACDVLINASPVGLAAGGALPVSLDLLRPGALVVDIAALARETELLASARAIGCVVMDGEPMLKAQIEFLANFITDATED